MLARSLLVLTIVGLVGCAGKRLQITWPHGVEVSSGMDCRVVLTSQAQGDCVSDANEAPSGVALWWRACGYVEWASRGPHGEDLVAKLDLHTGDSSDKSFDKAWAICGKYRKAYRTVRKAR